LLPKPRLLAALTVPRPESPTPKKFAPISLKDAKKDQQIIIPVKLLTLLKKVAYAHLMHLKPA
jgi:hypothetical protein